jgi:hypothetical protein
MTPRDGNLKDDEQSGRNGSEGLTDTFSQAKKSLDRIPPAPRKQSNPSPDNFSQLEIDDARKDPIVSVILIAILTIGVVLILASIFLDFANAENAKVRVVISPTASVSFVQEFFAGLGVELAASAIMLYLFFNFISRSKTDEAEHAKRLSQPQRVFVIAIFGAALIVCPLLCGEGTFASVGISLGIEVVGATVIFAVLDNVLPALNGNGSEGSN